MKKKIEPNMICIFDKNNETKQDISGVLNVRVLKLKTQKLFSAESEWEVVSIEGRDPKPFICKEKYLTPSENMVCVVRNPIDMPTFNSADITSINQAMYLLNNNLELRGNKVYIDTMQRLNALKEKIKFTESLSEV